MGILFDELVKVTSRISRRSRHEVLKA